MSFKKALLAPFIFLLLAGLPTAMPACRLSTEFPLTYPGASVDINVSYSDFPFPSPIAVVCRPNMMKFCFIVVGSGECTVSCDYPSKGVFTVTAASLAGACSPALIVADPGAKPACVLTPETTRGNGTLSTRITARFSNLLPNVDTVLLDCGNGQRAAIAPLIGKSAQATCRYSAEGRKEVYAPNASAGGAKCFSQVVVIPTSDSEPPQVWFFNLTHRTAIRTRLNITINATDNVEIDRVELYINGSLASTMRTPPYSYVLSVTNYSNGTEFEVLARAYDIYGNQNVTPRYTVSKAFDSERACNLTADPIYSPIPGSITLTARFFNVSSDVLTASFKSHWPYGTINKSEPQVQINDGVAKTIIGYSTPGTYTAYATDGNISCTTKVYITAVPDQTPPTVSLTSPSANQYIQIQDNVSLASIASDNVAVRNIEYYLDDKFLANGTESPFNSTWNTADERIGVYNVRAVAYDVAGNPSITPRKVQVILYTNKTCAISPPSVVLQTGKPANFTVSCYNYTRTNFSQPVTNATGINGTKNFTISSEDMLQTQYSKITCPEMEWSSTIFWSEISPRTSPYGVQFTPRETDSGLQGTLTATDIKSGFSCSARITAVKDLPACFVSADSPIIVGSTIPVNVTYENMSKAQSFTVSCRPNVVSSCEAGPGSGSCIANCNYPVVGRFTVSASSPSTPCASKRVSVLPHPDSFPPVVSLTKPFSRQIVNGIPLIEAYATDNFGVSSVEFWLGEERIGIAELSPYQMYLNTSGFRNGEHLLTAKAYDESGNEGINSITITIAN